jgi:hypothetical protein
LNRGPGPIEGLNEVSRDSIFLKDGISVFLREVLLTPARSVPAAWFQLIVDFPSISQPTESPLSFIVLTFVQGLKIGDWRLEIKILKIGD